MRLVGMRRLVSPSMAVAFTALLVALGGTSYAVTKLDPRSVGTREMKRGAVGTAQLKRNAVVSRTVRNGSLTGDDINEASLAAVPRATTADRATATDVAARASGLDRVFYRAASGTLATGTARCDIGMVVVGGGGNGPEGTSIASSFPDGAGAWTVVMANDELVAQTFSVFAICVPAGGIG